MTEPSTTQRDDLAETLNEAVEVFYEPFDWHESTRIAARILTAGYRKLDPTDETAIDKVAATLATSDGWLSLAHPSPRHQTLLRERARAILTVLVEPEAEAAR